MGTKRNMVLMNAISYTACISKTFTECLAENLKNELKEQQTRSYHDKRAILVALQAGISTGLALFTESKSKSRKSSFSSGPSNGSTKSVTWATELTHTC